MSERILLILQVVSGRSRSECSMRYQNCLISSASEADAEHTFAHDIDNYREYAEGVVDLHFIAHPCYCDLLPFDSYPHGHLYMSPVTGGGAPRECIIDCVLMHSPPYEDLRYKGGVMSHDGREFVLSTSHTLYDFTTIIVSSYKELLCPEVTMKNVWNSPEVIVEHS